MYSNMQGNQGGSVCLAKAGLAEGTNAGTIQTANAVDYSVGGILYTKALTDNIAMTAAEQQAVGTYCMYGVQLDASGNFSTVKGEEVSVAEVTADEKGVKWPTPEVDKCMIGAVLVQTDGSTTFTAGTTDLGAAGITDTYYDLMAVPTRPLVP